MDDNKSQILREICGFGRVNDLPGLAHASWDDISNGLRDGRYSLGADSSAGDLADKFALGAIRWLRAAIVTLPFTNALVLVIAAIITANYWLILGIPLIFITHLVAPPPALRGTGAVVFVAILATLFVTGSTSLQWIAGSMLVQFLSRKYWYRSNTAILQQVARREETTFVALYVLGVIILRDNETGYQSSMPVDRIPPVL